MHSRLVEKGRQQSVTIAALQASSFKDRSHHKRLTKSTKFARQAWPTQLLLWILWGRGWNSLSYALLFTPTAVLFLQSRLCKFRCSVCSVILQPVQLSEPPVSPRWWPVLIKLALACLQIITALCSSPLVQLTMILTQYLLAPIPIPQLKQDTTVK